MSGDMYQVFTADARNSTLHATYGTWAEAKEKRNELFFADRKLRAAWVMRINPSMDLRPERWGFTMRRTRHEAA